jgi:hypothetical protein
MNEPIELTELRATQDFRTYLVREQRKMLAEILRLVGQFEESKKELAQCEAEIQRLTGGAVSNQH